MQIDCYGFEATSQFFKRKELDALVISVCPLNLKIAVEVKGASPRQLRLAG